MSYLRIFCVILSVFFLGACAATPPLPPDYSYCKDGIKININADPMLNEDQGSPHTLYLCVYELKDPNAFNLLASDIKGIYRLLECSPFDHSVTYSRSIIVQPGQVATYSLDRAEGTRFVAVCAGYYNINRAGVVRLYEIPVVTKTQGVLTRTEIAVPEVLNIDLDLGPTAIRSRAGK